MSMPTQVVQATAWYPPYGIGGTETYVEGLVAGLSRRGFSNRVILPRPEGAPTEYEHQGVPAQTYFVNEVAAPEEKYGAPHQGFERFVGLLRAATGAIYHQHSWTRGLGLAHLRAARGAGLRTVLTVHVASNICMRGTMVRHGVTPCDGLIEAQRCGACWAGMRGAPRPVAEFLARLPIRTPLRGNGRLYNALSAGAFAAQKRRDFDEMIAHADRVVAVCQWLYDALLINGVPRQKLVLSRQGLPDGFARTARVPSKAGSPLRLLYLGRWHPFKGVDVVVRAVRSLPDDVPVELALHGVAAGAEESAYREKVLRLAEGDPRIRFLPPLRPAQVAHALTDFDVLLVPSVWLETGPLVVLEAKAAGLFVVGSRLGGIAELVSEPDEGLLLPPSDVAAWASAIAAIAQRPRPLAQPRDVRTMDDVAREMADLYEGLIAAPSEYALRS
jgi:glycosyltransferase involved in cell wall biosynthesis